MNVCWMCHGWGYLDKQLTDETAVWSDRTGGEHGERFPIFRLVPAFGTHEGEPIPCPFCGQAGYRDRDHRRSPTMPVTGNDELLARADELLDRQYVNVLDRNQFDLLTGALRGLLELLIEDWTADVPVARDPWAGAGVKQSGTGSVWNAINQGRAVLMASELWVTALAGSAAPTESDSEWADRVTKETMQRWAPAGSATPTGDDADSYEGQDFDYYHSAVAGSATPEERIVWTQDHNGEWHEAE